MYNYGMNNGMGMMGGIPQQGTGYQYAGMTPQQVPTFQNNLTNEEIQKLLRKENNYSLAVTETDKLRACCNHKWPDGKGDAILENKETGVCTCQICNYEFEPIGTTTTVETLRAYVKDIIDVLQTIKMIYIDMPADVAREYFVIIPLIEKIPDLFERAAKCYARYDSVNPYMYNNRNMNTIQMFNMLSGILNSGVAPQPVQPQQFGNPVFQQQPFMNPPMMGMPQQPQFSNGFVAGAPNYAPQTNGFQYVPGQTMVDPNVAQAQAAPGQVPPTSQTATTDGSTVNVEATFKA